MLTHTTRLRIGERVKFQVCVENESKLGTTVYTIPAFGFGAPAPYQALSLGHIKPSSLFHRPLLLCVRPQTM